MKINENESIARDRAPAIEEIVYPYLDNRVRRAGTMNQTFFTIQVHLRYST